MTVVSAFYNRQDSVDASVTSLAMQDFPSFRAIIVDDGSRDDTFPALQRHASDRIEVRRQANIGFTRTMIALCAEATSEFIAVHGAGDESFPHRLAAQVAFLRAHPEVVAVGCGIENVDELTGRCWEVRPAKLVRKGPISGDFAISHGEVMFRRDAYLQAGGYRAAFTVGQASDLFRRMSRLGDFGYVDDILYRRYLRLDGVNAKPEQVAKREILAAISIAAHQQALAAGDAGGKDELDQFALLYPYFSNPDATIAKSLARAAVMLWVGGDRAMALRLGRRSLGEHWTVKGCAAFIMVALGTGLLRAPMLKFARGMSQGEGEFDFARINGASRD
ncbi:glycosyltransferase family 2 protein [Sphingomonas sp. 37zxx]|uniref:glycosyltransferase family 2 protein n=1 Tax=Sphingomonas sp. 37zxx TaxID=1550073 RepID=UPI0018CF987D|nr:glycosyltransferase family A protein [Sphingomonas sp. 37zxx]